MLFPTTLVGSYPQPEWLIDRKKLAGRFPPRVRAKELWRIAPEYLEEAWNDATLLAIRAQERAGIDIISDGARRWTAAAIRIQSRASPARSAAAMP
jgi:5-methyltetrahydropteroyltriglutamate--homocysteine methyltransferase